jgi:hypothetical protein
MGRRLSMATRAELLEVVRERYASARPAERCLVLDEFVAVSGYHRKHAIRLLRQPPGVVPLPTVAGAPRSTTRRCERRYSWSGRPPTGSAASG